jgi:hypothetical protein
MGGIRSESYNTIQRASRTHLLLLLLRDMQHAIQMAGGLRPEVYVAMNVKCVQSRV